MKYLLILLFPALLLSQGFSGFGGWNGYIGDGGCNYLMTDDANTLAHWWFSDENTDVTKDLSDNSNTLTTSTGFNVDSSYLRTAPFCGNSLWWDGENDWFDLSSINIGETMSISMVVYFTESDNWIMGSITASNMLLRYYQAGGVFYLYPYDVSASIALTSQNLLSAWHYVVITKESGSATTYLYVDGNLEDTTTITGSENYNFEFRRIGARVITDDGYPLTLDELQIHNRVLSASEISTHWDKIKGKF